MVLSILTLLSSISCDFVDLFIFLSFSLQAYPLSPVNLRMVQKKTIYFCLHAQMCIFPVMGESPAFELLQRVRSNDRTFIADLRQIIERVAHKWNWTDRETQADIAQDCFLKIITNLENGKFEGRSSFKTYVYTIVRRTCIDFYRADRAIETTDFESASLVNPCPSQEEQLISREERKTACRVLLSLPAECRKLWRAIFFGKRNYKQAAELLGLKEGTVKRKMWECRQLAKEKVKLYEK